MDSLERNPDDLADSPAPERVFLPLLRFRRFLLLCTVVGIAAGVLQGVVRPNEYVSTGKLLVLLGSREKAPPDADVDRRSSVVVRGEAEDVQNEAHLLTNPSVFERVVERVGPEALLRPYDPTTRDTLHTSTLLRWFHEAQRWWFDRKTLCGAPSCTRSADCPSCRRAAVRALLQRTQVAAEPRSDVVTISCRASDPALARTCVEAFLEVAHQVHRETYYSGTTSYEFLKQQKDAAGAAALEAARHLASFRAEVGVFDLEAQRENLLAELLALKKHTAESRERLTELAASAEYLRRRLAETPQTLEQETGPVSTPNPVYLAQLEVLNRLRVERGELLTTYHEDSEFVKAKTRLIDQLEEEIAQMPVFVRTEGRMQAVSNTGHERLAAQLDLVEAELHGLEPATAQREARAAELKADLQEVHSRVAELEALEQDFQLKQESAGEFARMFERSRLQAALDQADVTNLRTIQSATLPLDKSAPSRGKYLLVLGFVGLAFGCVVAYLRASFDPRIWRPEEVEEVVAMPVLATLRTVRPARGRAPSGETGAGVV
jgi:uncharacterized protein involved in exopolysaccharide biosynthesis